jgi:hypothetical protein
MPGMSERASLDWNSVGETKRKTWVPREASYTGCDRYCPITAACSSTSAEAASAAYCGSLQTLYDAAHPRTLTSSSTVEEAHAVADAVRSAYDGVIATVDVCSHENVRKLNDSTRDRFDDAVSEIPDSGELGLIHLELQEAITTFTDGAVLAPRTRECSPQ